MPSGHLRRSSQSVFAAVLLAAVSQGVLISVAAPAAAQQARDAEQRYSFDIRTRSLAEGIAEIGSVSGWRIAYAATLPPLSGERVVAGTLSVPQALERLLADTGLMPRRTGDRAVVVEPVAPGDGATLLNPIRVEQARPADAVPPAYAGGMVASGGRLGMLGNRDGMDAPVSVTSYTSQYVEDRQAQTIADVVKTDPSVRTLSSTGGMLDSYSIRGFPMNTGNSGEVALNGTFGVAPNYRALANFAERIEVLKGPSALLNGMAPNSGVGGVINIVPKRAEEIDRTRASLDYSPGAQAGGSLDVSRRFGPDDAFGIRVNAALSDGDTPLDNQTSFSGLGSIALDYTGEDLRATLDMIYQRQDLDAPSRELMVVPGISMPDAPNGRRNVTQSWEWSETSDFSGLFHAEYDVTDAITVFGSVGGGRTSVDRLFGYPQIQNDAGDTLDSSSYMRFQVDRLTADAGVRGTFETGDIGHAVSLQAGHYNDIFRRGAVYASQSVSSNIYNPLAADPIAVAAPATRPKISETQLRSIALADTLSFFDDRVLLTVGGRYQTITSDNFTAAGAVSSSYDESVLTPMVGLVVKPWETVSFYGNYIEGLSKGDVAPNSASNAGEALSPYVAKQIEAGVKVDIGDIGATLGLFQITKPFGQVDGGRYTSGGEQRNRGLELNVFGKVTPEIRVLAGMMLLDAEITDTATASQKGNTPVGVPSFQANLTAEWDTPFVPGLTLSGTVVHTGSQYVDAGNSQEIPDWTTLDLGVRYKTELVDTPVTVRATVQNVFDTGYWASVNSWGMVAQGAPRTALLSISADF